MDSRKIKILNAIISSYIDLPVPVGSRTLSKEFDLGVSSATIRNEMADLEDLGYLNKPHQSAGRIPSEKAYRFYVNEFYRDLDFKDYLNLKNDLVKELLNSSNNPSEFFQNSVRLLAKITNCAAFLVAPKKSDTTIKLVNLIKLERNSYLLLIVGNKGIVEKHLLTTNHDIPEEELSIISNRLNEELAGIDFQKISQIKILLKGKMIKYSDFLESILNRAKNFNNRIEAVDLYCDGLLNILDYEEYRDIEKARDFLSLIEDRNSLIDILKVLEHKDKLDVIIGSENEQEALKSSSIIRAVYKWGEFKGSLGIIGPVRLDYERLINTVGIFGETIAEVSQKLFGVY